MSGAESEIIKTLIVGTVTVLVLGSILVIAIYQNQKRFIRTQREKLEILENSKQALQASHDQLRRLTARLQIVREEERERIAREIHDELGQYLTAIKMDISFVKKNISIDKSISKEKEISQELDSISAMIDTTVNTVRKIATELRPEILDELGLKEAIAWEAQQFQDRMRIKCIFLSEIDDINLDRDCGVVVFRILQEALTNVARHANATQVLLNLSHRDGLLELQIQDNGRGVKQEEIDNSKSLGLLGMRERALMFGGDVQIKGENGRGTTVTLRIPTYNMRSIHLGEGRKI